MLHPRRPLLCDILFCSGDLHCVPDIVLGDVPGLHQIGRHSEDAGQAPKQVAVVPVPKAADALPPSAGYRRRIASEQYGSTSIQHKALASGSEKELSDMGLRYDLTLPLSRYYAANREQLPAPFKVIQTDRVYRAERPQKGRLREFVQCDIDILGDESPNAEVELIDVTARALLAIGFSDFTGNMKYTA